MDRRAHKWVAQLQRDDGQVVERKMSVYWDPSLEDAAEAVARTAAAEQTIAEGRSHRYVGITATRVEA